ncbi:MAG TPA: GGDEF domain-containing protein [Fimbriiglobus sp.]|jgi:diguanylate cyclase (GGDEF)-like protein
MDVSLLATIVQAVGTLLVAALLRELIRVIPGRFLSYWSLGWLFLSVALFALTFSYSEAYRGTPTASVLTGVYCVCEYTFGFLLWAGCRNFACGRVIQRRDLPLLVAPVVLGILLPIWLSDINYLMPVHSTLFGGYFLISFLAIRSYHLSGTAPGIGQKLIRASLLGLTVLLWHYTAVLGWATFVVGHPKDVPAYLNFSSVYDALIEVGLAFGMVVLATERVRNELEERNRQLAAATAQLAKAAKTDPLTGLLNRRAFDELADAELAPGALAVIDLNDLKRINDRYLHAAGDAAIQLVARALRTYFRVSDPLFRTGGDEFLVVMPGGNTLELVGRMAKLDGALTAQRLPGVPDLVDIGIAWGVEPYERDIRTAHARADRAMYEQKQRRKLGTVALPAGITETVRV